MSTTDRETGRPYSERAMRHAQEDLRGRLLKGWEELRMGADLMHDREALGLDASARIGDILDEVVGLLQADTAACFLDGKMFAGETLQSFKMRLLNEFGASHDC